MRLANSNFCPLINADCRGLGCSWFIQVRGFNPQSGAEVDEWDCAVKWLPVMLVENAQMSRQTGAAVESFRNEVRRQHDELTQIPTASVAARFAPAARDIPLPPAPGIKRIEAAE